MSPTLSSPQVWRNGSRQARLARFLASIDVHPFEDGPPVGELLARSRTSDVVAAHLVMVAVRLGDSILTGDVEDLSTLVAALNGRAPTIHVWPPSS